MTIIEDQQAKYLIKSLQHHPSPYLILSKNTGIEWMNKSSQYVFLDAQSFHNESFRFDLFSIIPFFLSLNGARAR